MTRYIATREAAEYLGVSLKFFERQLAGVVPRANVAPAHAKRAMWRYDREDLDAYMHRDVQRPGAA